MWQPLATPIPPTVVSVGLKDLRQLGRGGSSCNSQAKHGSTSVSTRIQTTCYRALASSSNGVAKPLGRRYSTLHRNNSSLNSNNPLGGRKMVCVRLCACVWGGGGLFIDLNAFHYTHEATLTFVWKRYNQIKINKKSLQSYIHYAVFCQGNVWVAVWAISFTSEKCYRSLLCLKIENCAEGT